MNFVIRTAGLCKSFATVRAVDGLDLTVERGKIYGFLGRNGAGKTTTIRMLTGLLRPDSGDIEIFGENFATHAHDILPRIGALIDTPGFYPNLSGWENLLVHARLSGLSDRRLLDEALEVTGLAEHGRRLVKHYSSGMKQRLGIARALLAKPELLILDEPTTALDPAGIRGVREHLQTIVRERGTTIFYSSHILDEVEQLADTIGIIHRGRMLQQAAQEDLRRGLRKFLKIRVDDENKAAWLLERQLGIQDYEVQEDRSIHVFSHLDRVAEINRRLVQGEIAVHQLTPTAGRLEDHFLELTKEEDRV